MASKFQNRLVGTIILVALGVIILPGLLDGKKKHYQDEFAAIPLVPKPGDSDELDATPPEMKASPPAAVKQEAKPVARPESKPVPKPPASKPDNASAAEQAPKGQAWVVQLGALKNADKVSEIVAKLRLSGYRVYTSPPAPVQGQITRIFVGPDASKEKLQTALGELNQLSGLNGQLRPYSGR